MKATGGRRNVDGPIVVVATAPLATRPVTRRSAFLRAVAERDGEMEVRCRDGTLLSVLFGVLVVVTVPGVTKQSATATCEPYSYCTGESLDAATVISGRTVYCDIVNDPKERCCLPQATHVVCYDILVDGKFLNYDPSGKSPSTDFSALCEAIAEERGKQAGKYSAVSGDDATTTIKRMMATMMMTMTTMKVATAWTPTVTAVVTAWTLTVTAVVTAWTPTVTSVVTATATKLSRQL
ncbi:hypothetical protein LSAT2_021332 [Lamellibrachia satsuma]|nr:hypothetical protein LSAT2_021332 [Lamellibrachia satsuma]